MKVLIVDDSSDMRDALSELILMNSYDAVSAGTVDDALASLTTFQPNMIFMDADINAGETQILFNGIRKMSPRPILYVLTNDRRKITSDVVTGYIHKPFKGADILEIVDMAAEAERKKRPFLKGLFHKRAMPPASKGPERDMGLKFGRAYLFIENEPAEIWDACTYFYEKDEDMMFITSGNAKAVKERIRDEDIRVCALSDKEGENSISGSRIGSVTGAIASFIGSVKRPVIVMDDLGMLIRLNDLNSVLTMIQQTLNNGHGRAVTILASISPEITEKDKGLLLHNMTVYKTDR
ncbi:MAG: response regulator [Methanomassiliicoccaceae archaeon]|jgi:CheY-like chemotaxis protein|nr:response regulator [Methanomassiliicoccaceae archaeon]